MPKFYDDVRVIDADTHFTEPPDLWTSRAPAAYRDRVLHIEERNGVPTWVVDDVEVGFAKGNAHGGKIESSGGSITVELDPTVDLNIDASTSGGSVRTDIPIKVVGKLRSSSVQGTLGKGGESLKVHTSGGSVSIGARDDSN